MYLRKLEAKDAGLMLEWMHDESVVRHLHADFASKTIVDCLKFIKSNQTITDCVHYAIASDEDEYMGTVSLKSINKDNLSAEFAITVRAVAMAHGYAWFGMKAILNKAFKEYGLECVYWCVSKENIRAVKFYEKHNFHEVLDINTDILARYEGMHNLKWYSVQKGDNLDNITTVAGCRIIRIKTVPTLNAGELSFFESNYDVPFEIKRIYYISKVPEGVKRGFHAHKELKQLLFCPYGRIKLILESKNGREEIVLCDPSIGVVITQMTWREMLWLQKDSVLCVAASDYYKVDDYVRDYNDFKRIIREEQK